MISTRGRYALRMMLDLAANQGEGYVALKDVAARQGISKKYLEQIIPVLNRAGLLQTARGVQGGYRLTRRPEEYTLGDVLRATEATLASVACLEAGAESCPRQGDCLTYPVWIGLDKVVNDYLESITLQDILDRRQNAVGNDYVI